MQKKSEEIFQQKWNEKRSFKAQRICGVLKSLSNNNVNPVILDLGCYEGSMDEYFSKFSNNQVIGIDVSLKALKKAKDNAKTKKINVQYIQANANHLPIKSGKIDWIICNHVIDYLEKKEELIDELIRILNESGLIYLAVISKRFLQLYRYFPFIFKSILGAFYGRSYPSYDSKFGTPKSFKFWKNHIPKKFNLEIKDLTSKFMSDNLDLQNLNQETSFIKSVISRLSPSWVFVLHRKNEGSLE